MKYDLDEITNGLFTGDLSYLSRSITLIESTSKRHFKLGQDILESVLGKTGSSIRIGITGPPGVGKSTLIDILGLYYCNQGYKTAVLAIDPSSKVSGGSILGDKTRMTALAQHKNSYIRPTPSSGMLGGTASRTKESILLCEAAGFERIIIETVGVGQNEINISSIVDVLVMLLNPGSGDELQGIKRGILEVSDILAINKSDTNDSLVNDTVLEYKNAFRILNYDKEFWRRKVIKISAIEGTNLKTLAKAIDSFCNVSKETGFFEENRTDQERERLIEILKEEVLKKAFRDKTFESKYNQVIERIKNKQTTAIKGVMELLDNENSGSNK
ncbi:MAG: methylmalonyl Co-A mutase-associated GTPase MeaB [Candidatus Kapaibacterium sp.]